MPNQRSKLLWFVLLEHLQQVIDLLVLTHSHPLVELDRTSCIVRVNADGNMVNIALVVRKEDLLHQMAGNTTFAPGSQHSQIGRASCRERV